MIYIESNDSRLPALIQAYLFAEGGTLSIKRLSQLTGAAEDSVKSALRELPGILTNSGLSLLMTDSEATLSVSAPESDVLAHTYHRELAREIGDAGLEVLAILLYRGPSTRAQIDYIRGVNTTSTIRALLSRGLITRAGTASDSREFIYRATPELLAHIGATSEQELPEYGTISSELQSFEVTGPFSNEYERANTTDNTGGAGPTV